MWNASNHQIELILIRHGQTKGNERHAYIGRTEEELSDLGKEKLRNKNWDFLKGCGQLYISPMIRCVQTAKIICPFLEPVLMDGFKETDFGDFEGKNYQELASDERYQAWINSNGELAFPNGESKMQVRKRVLDCLDQVLKEEFARSDFFQSNFSKKVVLVIHGGTIMTILSFLCGGNYYDYQVKNGEGYRCLVEETGSSYRISHLEKIGVCEDEK